MDLEQELLALVKRAWEEGVVMTVTQHSLPPYQMGHYYTRIATRPSHGKASSIMLILVGDESVYRDAAQLRLEP